MTTTRAERWLLLAAITALLAVLGPSASALAASPHVQITTPLSGSTINDSTPVFAGVTDDFPEGEFEELTSPEVQLSISGGPSVVPKLRAQPSPGGTWSVESTAPLADGVYTAHATQTDPLTGKGESQPVTFTIDTVAPEVTLTSPVNGSSTSNGVEQVSGAAGTAPGDAATVTIELFAGTAIGAQSPLEMLVVPASNGGWSGSLGGLSPGAYTVEATQRDAAGNSGRSSPVSFTDVAAAPSVGLPTASFTWVPTSPTTGQSISLVSNSTDAASPIGAFAWDVLGTGPFVPAGAVRTTSFSTAGPHVVRLRVTDGLGQSSVATKTINVTNAPLTLMQPFPIVRIAGSVTSGGAKISLLTVQAPVAANVTVTCKGRGCKTKSESRVATASKNKGATPLLEFQRFERRLPAGVRLQIRVTRPGQIGKYTSFVIRRHKPPTRNDACLRPNSATPIGCPKS